MKKIKINIWDIFCEVHILFFSIGVCKTTKYEVMMKGEIKNEKMVLCYKEKKLEEIKRLKES